MTQLSLDGGAVSSPPATLGQQMLAHEIALRHARLTDLETEMTAACEAAALHQRSPGSAPVEREHWDRATWHRYLAAAMRLEATYGPPMRRLRQEIGQLERLKTLLSVV